jgi:hypothetical protein
MWPVPAATPRDLEDRLRMDLGEDFTKGPRAQYQNSQRDTMNVAPHSRLGQLPNFLSICVRHVHGGRRKHVGEGFKGPEGHGENIWVFGHRRTDQIVYSFDKKLDVSSIRESTKEL